MEEDLCYNSDEEFELIAERAMTKFNNLGLANNYVRPDFNSYPNGDSDEISDITDKEEVIRWIRRYYVGRAFLRLEKNINISFYDSMIERAIKNNLPEIVNILHLAIYYHDRSCPDYTNDLKIALSFANLETLQLVFYNFFKGFAYDGVRYMSRKEFDDCIKLNPYQETKDWVNNNKWDLYDIIKYRISDF